MFAVMKTGGKQYKVAKSDKFTVEKLAADAGEIVQFNEVLMLGGETVVVGAPFVEGAAVQAEVIDQIRGPKTISFKKRRRKHSSQRTKGHRQSLTVIRVTEILASGAGTSGVKAALGASTAPATVAMEAAAETAVAGTQPANLLTAAKGVADDLKRISGVGPKLEQSLNEIGVYHFWQIADWGPAEVAFMDDKLSFKGRIDRDGWIKQAADFAAETH